MNVQYSRKYVTVSILHASDIRTYVCTYFATRGKVYVWGRTLFSQCILQKINYCNIKVPLISRPIYLK